MIFASQSKSRRRPPQQAASNESSVITLRGSTDIIVDFFQHAITCILYQRGIYPPEDFERASKYGLALHVAKEEGLVAYIQNVLAQLKGVWWELWPVAGGRPRNLN
jgi:hypothetical protein